MPGREVVVSVAAYVDVNGVRRFALRGDSVDVHPDHVERFDALNVQPGAPAVVVVDDGDEVANDGPIDEGTPSEQLNEELPASGDELAEWLSAESAWRDEVAAWLAAEGAHAVSEDDRLNAVLSKRPTRTRAKG